MVCWYVENNKVSHINPKFSTMIIEAIAKQFGYLVITRGKKCTFLCMDIEILDNNKLAIGMKSYIQEAVDFFNEEMSTKVSSPENKIYS